MTAVELIKEIKRIGSLWDSDIAYLLQVTTHSVNMWANNRTQPREYFVAELKCILDNLLSYRTNVGNICCRIKALEVLEDCKTSR